MPAAMINLLLAVAVLAVILAVAIPRYSQYRAEKKAVRSILSARDCVDKYAAMHQQLPSKLEDALAGCAEIPGDVKISLLDHAGRYELRATGPYGYKYRIMQGDAKPH